MSTAVDDSTHKVCRKCGERKPRTEYGTKRSNRDGLQARCRPCLREDKAASYARNRETANARSRAYYEAHREQAIAAAIAWKANNPDRARAYRRTNYLRRREHQLETARKWQAANPDKMAEAWRRRRARVKKATIGTTDLEALWEAQGGLCALCGDQIDRSLRWPHPLSPSVDHILPLSMGGAHEQSNLQWTHLAGNLQKGASVPESLPL